jgi:hypothetical protein
LALKTEEEEDMPALMRLRVVKGGKS